MIKVLLIAFSTLLVALVITYSWFNRDSDRVVLTLITAMTIGALGFITKESISNKTIRTYKQIPVAVFYGVPNYQPANIKLPYILDLRMCTQNINPEDIPDQSKSIIDIKFGEKIYFDAIQYLMINTVFQRFNRGWNVEATRTLTPSGEQLGWRTLEVGGMKMSISDFSKKISDNYFIKSEIHKNLHNHFGGEAYFPPGSKITIEDGGGEIFNDFKLHIQTKYISFTLELRSSTSSIGIGEYAQMLEPPLTSSTSSAEGSNFDGMANSVYLIDITVEQNVLLNGHPEMAAHKNWADSIIELIDSKFNYETIRANHIDQFKTFGKSVIFSRH